MTNTNNGATVYTVLYTRNPARGWEQRGTYADKAVAEEAAEGIKTWRNGEDYTVQVVCKTR